MEILGKLIGVNLGWRRDFIGFDNTDLLRPQNSFARWAVVDSPKATVSIFQDRKLLPALSFSYGQTYFTNDPRIGLGTQAGSLLNRAHAYQLVASKTISKTDLRVTLSRVSPPSNPLARLMRTRVYRRVKAQAATGL